MIFYSLTTTIVLIISYKYNSIINVGSNLLNQINYLNMKSTSEILIEYNLLLISSYLIFRTLEHLKTVNWHSLIRMIPMVEKKIQKEINKSVDKIRNDLKGPTDEFDNFHKLPMIPLHKQNIKDMMSNLSKVGHFDYKKGGVSGTVYCYNEDLNQLWKTVFPIFSKSNPLHPDVFPGVRKMEEDIVRMCVDLFNGGSEGVGCFTSGGTESILLACKAYRDLGYSRGITKPEILVAKSAHCAFDKAGHYFGLKLVNVDLDIQSGMMNIKHLKRKISRNTIMIVGSAPSYPHGIIDPIKEISEIAFQHNIPFHVDCCLGGFLLPFIKGALDENIDFDFRLRGVTSISADCHKYGFCPKGGSVIMYRHHKYIHHQYYVNPDWMGGIYATSSLLGSRSGNIVALTWATLLRTGRDGYIKSTKHIVNLTRYFVTKIRELEYIFVYGQPKINVVALGSDTFDIYTLNDHLQKCGWAFNALQFPSSIHLCITQCHTKEIIDSILTDIKTFINDKIKKIINQNQINITNQSKQKNQSDQSDQTNQENQISKLPQSSSIYGSSQKISDRSIIGEVAKGYLDCLCN